MAKTGKPMAGKMPAKMTGKSGKGKTPKAGKC